MQEYGEKKQVSEKKFSRIFYALFHSEHVFPCIIIMFIMYGLKCIFLLTN